ncbi:hypothetical protein, partial [Enterococcus faecium]
MTTAPPTYLEFRLAVSKRAMKVQNGRDERIQERYDVLPDVPADFAERVGNYAEIAAIAFKMNEAQLRASYLDYL